MSKSDEFAVLAKALDANEYASRPFLSDFAIENRAIIARALRRDEALEHPGYALCADIGGILDMCEAFAMGSGADESVRGSEAITAFREAVK